MIPFICNGNFAVKCGEDREKGREVLSVFRAMGFTWSSRPKTEKESDEILDMAISSYRGETTLVVERKEKSVYYGGTSSWLRNTLRFTYDDFKKEIAECG